MLAPVLFYIKNFAGFRTIFISGCCSYFLMGPDSMSSPLVSIIIPTIGRRARLKRAVKSVHAQFYEPYELIIVGGSNDDGISSYIIDLDISAKYLEQSEKGLSNARNIGIEAASGDYVAFLDDDDWWQPEKLTRQVEVMRSAPETSAFVYTGIKSVNSDGELIQVTRPSVVPAMERLLTRNYIGSPSSVLARTRCVENVGCFDESLPSREEWDLYLRLCSQYDAEVISDPLVIKEKHSESMSGDVKMVERDWKRLYKKHKEKYTDEIAQKFWANYHLVLCRKYADQSDLANARRHALRSLQYRFNIGTLPYLFGAYLGKTGYNTLRKLRRRTQRFI